ncbi:hypothetical protein [Streptomyces sp. NPDC101150]|uniref:hypothetical protein n=1 Tax=Streptomyces sp. NPDC101150 TaxID=3366114 RepID=UPI00380E9325
MSSYREGQLAEQRHQFLDLDPDIHAKWRRREVLAQVLEECGYPAGDITAMANVIADAYERHGHG